MVTATARQIAVTIGIGRVLAILVLGIVLPGMLLVQSHSAMGKLEELLGTGDDLATVVKTLPPPIQKYETPYDYAMLAVTYVEASNQRAMVNKQRMKIAVMHIGFAVICVGLLFVVLGIDAGGIEIAGGTEKTATVNLKVASTGLAVFVLGAAMAAGGGLLPNPYHTVSIPGFGGASAARAEPDDREALAKKFEICERDASTPAIKRICLLNAATAAPKSKE